MAGYCWTKPMAGYCWTSLWQVTAGLAYGRILLDTLFARKEQLQSVIFSSLKSNWSPVNKQKVDLLISKLLTIVY